MNGFRLFICGGMIRVNTETYSHLPSSHKRTGSHTESYSYEYSYTFPWWRIRYSVISSRGYTPPALLASLKYAHPPCVLSLLALLTYLYFFLLFLTFFDFDLGIVCFRPAFFLWVLYCLLGFGFCCDSFSISYIYVCILIRTYADLTFLLSEVYDLFQLLCIVFCFICFPPE